MEGFTKLEEFLKELSRVAYEEAPVPYEMVQQFGEEIVAAIVDGDEAVLGKLRNWFILLPSEGDFALNKHGKLTDLRDLMGLLDTALELVISTKIAREVRCNQYKRTVIEFLAIMGPSMGYEIARPYRLDDGEVHVAATRLKSQGFLTGSMVNEQDPGYTWTITPRGRRLYVAMYK